MNHFLCAYLNRFLLLLSLLTFPAYAAISINDYGALPSVGLVAISPNGEFITFRKVKDKQDAVYIVSIKDQKIVFGLDVSNIQPSGIYFFNNDQVLMRVSQFTRVDGFIGKFDLSTAYVLNIKDKKVRQLLNPAMGSSLGKRDWGESLALHPTGNTH